MRMENRPTIEQFTQCHDLDELVKKFCSFYHIEQLSEDEKKFVWNELKDVKINCDYCDHMHGASRISTYKINCQGTDFPNCWVLMGARITDIVSNNHSNRYHY